MREITEVHVLIKCHKSVSFPVLTGAMGSEGWGGCQSGTICTEEGLSGRFSENTCVVAPLMWRGFNQGREMLLGEYLRSQIAKKLT